MNKSYPPQYSSVPSPGAMANRRFLVLLIAAIGIVFFVFGFSRSNAQSPLAYGNTPIHKVEVAKDTLNGDVIMAKMGNETAKAELGRASWKTLHTIMARFPDKPTQDEQSALSSYIHLFARLYPCGECAGHFRQILEKSPPQVSTRSRAAAWACHVHNEVNKSLNKDVFDCSNIGDFYDCGCTDKSEGKKVLTLLQSGTMATPQPTEPASSAKLKLEKDSQIRGG